MTEMDFKKEIRAMIPRNAPDLDAVFGSTVIADEARLILQYIFRVRIMLKTNQNFAPGLSREAGWCPVTARNLFNLIGNRYKSIIDKLIEIQVLELYVNPISGKKSYATGSFSMKYRVLFGDQILTGQPKYRVEKITTPRLIKKVVEFYKRSYNRQLEIFFNEVPWFAPNIEFLDSLKISESAFDKVAELDESDFMLGIIDGFNNGTSRFISNDHFAGRIHSYVSSLSKQLRPFLYLEGYGKSLVLVDVKSAQPFLLAALFQYPNLIKLIPQFEPIIDKIKSYKGKPDLRLFFEDCATGKFYTKWMTILNMDKDTAKKALFRHVLYSSASNQHKDLHMKEERMRVRRAFESLYPNVHALLTTLKRTRRKTLPFVYDLTKRGKKEGRMYVTPNMMAQRLEVAILLNIITKTCVAQDIFTATIHDAWIMKKSDLESFQYIFEECFAQLGIKAPQLEIEEFESWNNNMELLNSGDDEATD